ncbi:hypothetical protein [Flavisolibacter nicotianae]|uniref:hypothetical protein n=1 Tax=Flavisolibacter nicotianae TaxID=2364882 RepID=UPI000EADCC4E|nr:hypothetical protein [Flavisolibacter nicotianae]
MWKLLHSSQNVHLGDKIRYVGNSSFVNGETLYKVTKTDQYYFEIAPASAPVETTQSLLTKRIVKYFDIGHYIGLEVWSEN